MLGLLLATALIALLLAFLPEPDQPLYNAREQEWPEDHPSFVYRVSLSLFCYRTAQRVLQAWVMALTRRLLTITKTALPKYQINLFSIRQFAYSILFGRGLLRG